MILGLAVFLTSTEPSKCQRSFLALVVSGNCNFLTMHPGAPFDALSVVSPWIAKANL
jgi:hypothetical protein